MSRDAEKHRDHDDSPWAELFVDEQGNALCDEMRQTLGARKAMSPNDVKDAGIRTIWLKDDEPNALPAAEVRP